MCVCFELVYVCIACVFVFECVFVCAHVDLRVSKPQPPNHCVCLCGCVCVRVYHICMQCICVRVCAGPQARARAGTRAKKGAPPLPNALGFRTGVVSERERARARALARALARERERNCVCLYRMCSL